MKKLFKTFTVALIRLASICLGFSALFLILMLISTAPKGTDKGKRIDANFKAAKHYIEEVKEKEHRLPTSVEFEAWQLSNYHMRMNLHGPKEIPASALEEFGPTPPNGYVISYFRKYRFDDPKIEYYASWKDASTVDNTPLLPYMGGWVLAIGIAFFSLKVWDFSSMVREGKILCPFCPPKAEI